MAVPFSRALSQRANLAQQKTLAKELLHAFTTGDAEAIARVKHALPDKQRIVLADAQFVLAREYGFPQWRALKQHIDDRVAAERAPHQQLHDAMQRCDSVTAHRLLSQHAEFRPLINAPFFPYNAPALVACANDAAMVSVLLEFGADPNLRSGWWAGGFHALHSATGEAAERLLAAGAVPDACAAAHLDNHELLATMLAADPTRVAERGGDGQTPLHFARSQRVIDLLLNAGADINARDVDHRATAAEWMLDRARGAGRFALAQYLADRGAMIDIFLAAALGLTENAVAMLSENPGLLDETTGRGRYGEQPPSSSHIYFWTIGSHRSPLDVAAQFGNDDTLAAMLPFATALQRLRLVCRRGDRDGAHALLREQPSIVASLASDDRRSITAAAWNGDVRAVSLMLEIGFDPGALGQDRGTALHCAAWQGSAATVAAILQYPAGRGLLEQPDGQHGSTPLGWCCHGSLNGPRDGDFANVAKLLLSNGAQVGAHDASDEVEAVIAAWDGTQAA